MTKEEDYLKEAVALAREALDDRAGGPFGAVVVRDGVVVGRGRNRVVATNDPTAHAEVLAIRDACARLGTFQLTRATLYTSCEPCPMCLGAALWAHVARIVFAVDRRDAADAGFADAEFYAEVARAPTTRLLRMHHHADEDALRIMKAWAALPDRPHY